MNEDQWNAVIQCDAAYDGHFYYGVVTTGIYCKPSCISKTPNRKNVKIYHTPLDAQNDGLRPCKRCRPHLISSPSSQKELVENVMQLISNSYASDLNLQEISRQTYISPFYLQRVFKQETSMSPTQYLSKKRMSAAKNLLISSSLSITEIAFQIGFKNTSHFSSVFAKEFGLSPSKYRNINKKDRIDSQCH